MAMKAYFFPQKRLTDNRDDIFYSDTLFLKRKKSFHLAQELASISLEGQRVDSRYFRPMATRLQVLHLAVAGRNQPEAGRKRTGRECPNKTLFVESGGGLHVDLGPQCASPRLIILLRKAWTEHSCRHQEALGICTTIGMAL